MRLEVGMKIYGDGGRSCGTISRVTKCRAYMMIRDDYEREFERDVDGWFHRRGAGQWTTDSYHIETTELVAKYERYRKERRFTAIEIKDLSDEALDAILAIVAKVRGE